MRTARGSVLGTALVLYLLGLTSCLAAPFFENFGPGWEKRWIHSADDKYVGRFVTDAPEGWDGPGLKVGSLPITTSLCTFLNVLTPRTSGIGVWLISCMIPMCI